MLPFVSSSHLLVQLLQSWPSVLLPHGSSLDEIPEYILLIPERKRERETDLYYNIVKIWVIPDIKGIRN